MADLYEAQVDARAVPIFALEYIDTGDSLPGTESQTVHLRVGIPWPLARPWHAGESSVPFLTLDLTRERDASGPNFAALRHTIALTASLNREMDLVARWTRAEPTALEIIREQGTHDIAELSFVYAFGR
jgi:hypothetical protein